MRSRLLPQALGAASALTLMVGVAGTAQADSAPAPTALPSVSISTAGVVAADTVPPATTDPVQTAAAQPKPAVPHRPRHQHLQTIDTVSLTEPATSGLVGNSLIGHAHVIEARASALRPAPLPDQDVDAPGPDAQTLASQQEASVAPSFYGNKDHFSGDGFAAGSNLESDKNNRRKPGGGMSLSIPVQ